MRAQISGTMQHRFHWCATFTFTYILTPECASRPNSTTIFATLDSSISGNAPSALISHTTSEVASLVDAPFPHRWRVIIYHFWPLLGTPCHAIDISKIARRRPLRCGATLLGILRLHWHVAQSLSPHPPMAPCVPQITLRYSSRMHTSWYYLFLNAISDYDVSADNT